MTDTTFDVSYNKGWLRKYKIDSNPYYRKVCYDERKAAEIELNENSEPKQEYYRDFKTGSSYTGEWNSLSMNGHGKYTFLHGVIYEGGMKNGEFHGEGKITYPKGQSIKGIFHNGEMISWEFTFGNGLSMENYCKFPDRRFKSTIEEGFLPAGKERLTDRQPERPIPEGHYDVEDGFYNPKTGWIYSAPSFSQNGAPTPMRMPLKRVQPIDTTEYLPNGYAFIRKVPFVPIYQDEKFILERCRKAWDQPTGYRPDLYEKWMSGRAEETERYRKKFTTPTDVPVSNCLKMLDFFKWIGEARKNELSFSSRS
ncbi:MORN repeat-containing protein 5-like [Harmonia axyridis]|uniref:MORN repeat-containing protein 5-like n=1 Tax=Harmonia axyridis TaxID=115357 RepID=UPI001E275420|nr:MORN repeat-containing protein 5-like [Harmonia axyridis]